MLKATLFFIALFALNTAWSQDGYSIAKYGITISRFSDKALQEINATPDKEKISVLLEKECSQADFEMVCKKMDWITKLQVAAGNENIKNISAVQSLKNLVSFDLLGLLDSELRPVDMAPVGRLTKLKRLNLYGTKITGTDALANLKELKNLDLYMCDVASIDFLKHLPQLEELDLYGANHTFASYEPLAGLTKLTKLNIYMNPQAKDALMEPLNKLVSLEEIEFSNCTEITNLNFLKGLNNLRVVDADWSGVKNIDGLTDLTKLEEIHLNDCPVTDLSALKNKPELKVLGIENIKPLSLDPVFGLTTLQKLNISAVIGETQQNELTAKLPNTEINVTN